jgi:hypothetical protein
MVPSFGVFWEKGGFFIEVVGVILVGLGLIGILYQLEGGFYVKFSRVFHVGMG